MDAIVFVSRVSVLRALNLKRFCAGSVTWQRGSREVEVLVGTTEKSTGLMESVPHPTGLGRGCRVTVSVG
jgi:hypothetical protein